MKLDELVSKYIKLRDKKAQIKAEYDEKISPIDDMLKRIEGVILKTFQETGQENAKTNAGTAYKAVRTSASVADREAYVGWVLQDPEDRISFLDVRANKTAVESFRTANDDLPPGINWREEVVINIQRARA